MANNPLQFNPRIHSLISHLLGSFIIQNIDPFREICPFVLLILDIIADTSINLMALFQEIYVYNT
jgi:hypothetical protein